MDIPEKDLKHFRDAREQLAEAVGKMQAAFKDKTISKALAQEIYDTARQILDAGASLVSGLAQTAVAAVKGSQHRRPLLRRPKQRLPRRQPPRKRPRRKRM